MNNADKILEMFTNNKSWSRILYQFTWKHLFTLSIFWNMHFCLIFRLDRLHTAASCRRDERCQASRRWNGRWGHFLQFLLKKMKQFWKFHFKSRAYFLRKSCKKNLNFCLARPGMRLRDSFRGLYIGKDHHQVHDRRYSAQVIFSFQANTRTNVFQRVPRRWRPWSVRRDHHGRGTWAVRFRNFFFYHPFTDLSRKLSFIWKSWNINFKLFIFSKIIECFNIFICNVEILRRYSLDRIG